jgi:hypothetical protein
MSSDNERLPLFSTMMNRFIVTQKPKVAKPDVPLKAKTATMRETQIAVDKKRFFPKSPLNNKSKPLMFAKGNIRRNGRNSA